MGDNPHTADDRGNKAGDPAKPHGKKREGTVHEGLAGNAPHVRDEAAAILVLEMSGYGMSRDEISHALNRAYGGGYSVDTLDRHYRAELEQALAERKSKLLRRAHKIAMGEDLPQGVSEDEAYRTGARQLNWLLSAVHRVRSGVEHDFGAGVLNVTISKDDAEL